MARSAPDLIERNALPKALIEERGLGVVRDELALEKATDEAMAANPKAVSDYVNGKDNALNALFGAVMKATKGQAEPNAARQLLKRKLDALRETQGTGRTGPCSFIFVPDSRRSCVDHGSKRNTSLKPKDLMRRTFNGNRKSVRAKPNPYEVAVEQFMMAADKLNLDEGMKQILSQPKRELTVHFPVRMDDGTHPASSPAIACSTSLDPRPGQGRHPLPPGRDA